MTRLPDVGPAYTWQPSRTPRISPQTNTCLFCTLYPHSGAPGKDFPVVTHRSKPSTLNFEVFCDGLLEKKSQLVGMSIFIYPIKPLAGMSHTPPLEDWRPRWTTPSQERPLLATSVDPACQRMCHAVWPLRAHTSHAHHACATATTSARETAGVGYDTTCNDPGF
jgi:hypothetical protein